MLTFEAQPFQGVAVIVEKLSVRHNNIVNVGKDGW